MSKRSSCQFIAWTSNGGRARDIAADVGGDAVVIYPFKTNTKAGVIARYLVSAVMTIVHLCRSRPLAIIVTNPPVIPALLIYGYCKVTGGVMVLDSHPTSFGAKDHSVSKRLLPVHRWLAQRSAGVLVTSSEWVEVVEGWGAKGVIVHEPPVRWAPSADPATRTVLYVGTFASDEPLEAILDAASHMGNRDVSVTGDLAKCSAEARHQAPDNVTFTDFLVGADYQRAVQSSAVVVVLTTEPTSVMRAAYEAVWCMRPLVVTDTPLLRQTFPFAHFAPNEGKAIATAIDSALEAAPSDLQKAFEFQAATWRKQRDQLLALLPSYTG